MKTIQGKNKVLIGTLKETGERIWLSKPTFDCGWYWGFGYLGNKNCHYHLKGYQTKEHYLKLEGGTSKRITEHRNICMHDALLADYDLKPIIEDNLWVFCELALTAYTLKEAAEVSHRGGSHMTTNPCRDILKDETTELRINTTLLPTVMQELWNLIGGAS